ncbi:hypothetical protein [Streptomyces sp. NPDC059468]|uniref:hypothetical protein n=1 Tax=Streptomyces sp. NPDC059468 TaxID=3346845 RepID=UPI003694721E
MDSSPLDPGGFLILPLGEGQLDLHQALDGFPHRRGPQRPPFTTGPHETVRKSARASGSKTARPLHESTYGRHGS